MKSILDAVRRIQEAMKEPSAALEVQALQLARAAVPEQVEESVTRLLAVTEFDEALVEGDLPAMARGHLRRAWYLDRAGRGEEASAQAAKARELLSERGERSEARFRVHLALLDRYLAKDRPEAERQLGFMRDHVPMDEMNEYPQPECSLDLAAGCARLGRVEEVATLLAVVEPEARHSLLIDSLREADFGGAAGWARGFLVALVPFAREDDDPFLRAQRVTAVARLQAKAGWKEDARSTLAGCARAILARDEEDDDPELDATRAELADVCAQAGDFETALELMAPIPDAANLCNGLLRPLAVAGAPWRGRALELAVAAENPVQGLLEIAAGDVERGDKEDARAALTQAEEAGLEGADWGAVARVLADAGDAAGAKEAAEQLREVEIDMTDAYASLSLELAVTGAEAAGLPGLADEMLLEALENVAATRETAQFTRSNALSVVLSAAVEIAESRKKK